jgi:hypothetical protein
VFAKTLYEGRYVDIRLELIAKAQKRLLFGFLEDDVVMLVSDRKIDLSLVPLGGLR